MKKTAKKALSLFLCMFLCLSLLPVSAFAMEGSAVEPVETEASDTNIVINESNFPDAAFRDYVSTNFDSDSNGRLSAAEIANVTEISCGGWGLTSLKGIEFFPNLTYLSCWENQLTELDVSKNTALKELFCFSNQLTALDVSKNTALEILSCSDNQLTELDVSKNTALTALECHVNQLTALDVSKNTALETLICSDNQLTELDVSNNTALTELACYLNQLTALDVSKNTSLVTLSCFWNQIESLDLHGLTALEELMCGFGNPLRSLDLSDQTALMGLECSGIGLSTLDLSHNTELQYLYCGALSLSYPDENMQTNNVTELYLKNNLTELDLSNNTKLIWLSCGYNELTGIDVSGLTELEFFSCPKNHLAALDLINNTKLQTVECDGQTLPAQSFSQSGEKYILDLSALVGAENTGRITSVETGDYDPETGIASFDAPGSFIYYYSTGYGDTLMDVSCGEKTEGTGVALTGTAISWDGNSDEVICLYSGMTEDEVKTDIASGAAGARYTAQCGEAEQNEDGKRFDLAFSFADVEAGEYILAIYKPGNYVLLTASVTVSGDAGLGEFALQLAGDLSGDGNVNTMDLIRLMKYISGVEVDVAPGTADVNGDGRENTMDLIRLMKIVNGEAV